MAAFIVGCRLLVGPTVAAADVLCVCSMASRYEFADLYNNNSNSGTVVLSNAPAMLYGHWLRVRRSLRIIINPHLTKLANWGLTHIERAHGSNKYFGPESETAKCSDHSAFPNLTVVLKH